MTRNHEPGGWSEDLPLPSPLPTSLYALIRLLDLVPRKGMGQNFLIDDHYAEAIVASCDLGPKDRVVEIGPGLGSLTLPLSRVLERLVVIEKDLRLIPVLKARVGDSLVMTVESGNALAYDFSRLAAGLGGPLTIVANLPYNISSPMLLHLLEHPMAIDSMTLMFQKEVAMRISAPPGSRVYGSLSVQTALWMETSRLFDVPPGAFFPKPKVDSTVIRLKRRATPAAHVEDQVLFQQVIRSAFGQRRKTLKNALKTLHPQTEEWLHQAGIDPERRAETLHVEEFAQLTRYFPGDVQG